MSASMRPTRPPCFCRARARLAATVDLPTPPLPLATAIRFLTPGKEIFWGIPPGGCMSRLQGTGNREQGTESATSVPCSLFPVPYLRAFRALTQASQMFEGVNAAVVAVAPGDLVGVAADRLDPH